VLLDTHVWIWLVNGDKTKLGSRARKALARAGADQQLWVSTVSAFEIAALHVAGRLGLSQPVDRWVRESIARAGFRCIDLERDIAVDAGLTSPTMLGDPFDRCLVATAREYDLPLVTRDRRILDYASQTRLVKVVDASG
jgi:PIN domain nuclease of toxin-antitoxin system